MTRRPAVRPTYLLVGLFVFAAVAALAYRWLHPPFTPPVLPVPNGYDDLLRAAEMIPARTGFYDEMEPDELAAIVAQNKPALILARDALGKEIGVPVDWSRNLATSGVDPMLLDQASAMREICRAFAADMRDKRAHEQTNEAVSVGIDAFRLGNQCYRGGLVVNYLVGVAVQGIAIHELRQLVVEYPTVRSEILQRLVPLLGKGEPAEDVVQREVQFSRSALRGPQGWIMRLNYRTLRKLMEPAIQAVRQSAARSAAQQRLFVIHLALGAYRDAHGSWPNVLTDLSPEILKVVPPDPYVDAPFVYRVEADGYRLYSVGENRVDDGGEDDETRSALDVVYDLTTDEN